MDDNVKVLLNEVVNDLEDIRANVVVLLDRLTVSPAQATEGKNRAIALNHERYERLRKEIDAL